MQNQCKPLSYCFRLISTLIRVTNFFPNKGLIVGKSNDKVKLCKTSKYNIRNFQDLLKSKKLQRVFMYCIVNKISHKRDKFYWSYYKIQ